jgi:hypothetical protein
MSVNAFLHAAFVCGLAGCLWGFLGRKNGWLICFLLAPFYALPYAAKKHHLGHQFPTLFSEHLCPGHPRWKAP